VARGSVLLRANQLWHVNLPYTQLGNNIPRIAVYPTIHLWEDGWTVAVVAAIDFVAV
jgi:hypothetical protein